MSSKKLKPMSMDCISILVDLYKPYWPKTLPACTYLETLKKWKETFAELNITILGVDGDPLIGTFVSVVSAPSQNIFLESLNENLDFLKSLLLNCEYLDWTKKIGFSPIRSKFHSMLEEIFLEKKLVLLDVILTNGYWLESSVAKNIKIPERGDVIISKVTEKHAELINNLWPHKTPESLQLIQYMLKISPGVGIFDKETNELLSWVLRDEVGVPGLLQTIDTAKHKGYGSLATAYITKMYGEENKSPHVYVVKTNKISQALFTKFGYKAFDEFKWYTLCQKN